MKSMLRKISMIMAIILLFNVVPVYATENLSTNEIIADYMNARHLAITNSVNELLENYSVSGIVVDENRHFEVLSEENIDITAFDYEIASIGESDVMTEVVVEETITYEINNVINTECIEHFIIVMYEDNGAPIVVSDSYAEEYSGFVSASYVNSGIATCAVSGSESCIVHVAESQVGYYEKASNSNLDSFTANAGSANYTKYGEWYGYNGVAWCAIFVSWCANQANVATSIITKTASCDVSMNFFKNNSRFYASNAYGGSYTPQVGDVFFTGPSYTDSTHTGIITAVNGSTVTVVDGNSSDRVRERDMSLNDTSLIGFGNPAYANTSHTYVWKTASAQHWRECNACGYITVKSQHNWVYKSTYYQCSVCGMTSTTGPSIMSLKTEDMIPNGCALY